MIVDLLTYLAAFAGGAFISWCHDRCTLLPRVRKLQATIVDLEQQIDALKQERRTWGRFR